MKIVLSLALLRREHR